MPAGWTCSSSTSSPSPVCTFTWAAAGRSARTTTPPSYGWAPRIECGSPCSRRTSRSRSGPAAIMRSLVLQQADDRADRDRNPVGSIVQLVLQLVHGLLQLEHRQQLLNRLLAWWKQTRFYCPEVGVEEHLARPLLPIRRRRLPALELGRRGDVRERAQHPGDVTQRRAFLAPLGQAARRLALEVENDPAAVARQHHLAEVIVAVRADHAAADADLRELPEPLAHVLPATHDRHKPLVVFRQPYEDALDLLVDVRGDQRDRLGAR